MTRRVASKHMPSTCTKTPSGTNSSSPTVVKAIPVTITAIEVKVFHSYLATPVIVEANNTAMGVNALVRPCVSSYEEQRQSILTLSI